VGAKVKLTQTETPIAPWETMPSPPGARVVYKPRGFLIHASPFLVLVPRFLFPLFLSNPTAAFPFDRGGYRHNSLRLGNVGCYS
jgi:hypothetical protein